MPKYPTRLMHWLRTHSSIALASIVGFADVLDAPVTAGCGNFRRWIAANELATPLADVL